MSIRIINLIVFLYLSIVELSPIKDGTIIIKLNLAIELSDHGFSLRNRLSDSKSNNSIVGEVQFNSEAVLSSNLHLNPTNVNDDRKEDLKSEDLKFTNYTIQFDSDGNQTKFQDFKTEETKLKSENSQTVDDKVISEDSNDIITEIQFKLKKDQDSKPILEKLIAEGANLIADNSNDINLKGNSNGYKYYKCKMYYNLQDSFTSYGCYDPYDSYEYYSDYNDC